MPELSLGCKVTKPLSGGYTTVEVPPSMFTAMPVR